jgi:hypothetical protein
MIAAMSRDIFVQDIPPDITSVEQIPDDWMPEPLNVTAQAVREAVTHHGPHADFADPNWGHVTLSDADIEVNLSDEVPLMSFALHVRGNRTTADQFVSAVLASLHLRAFDPESETGLFKPE